MPIPLKAFRALICAALLSAISCISVGFGIDANAADTATHKSSLRVALDIGHSKTRFGATSARGGREYDFNRRFALELFTLAKQRPALDFFIINLPGGRIALRERTRIAADAKADLFLSIHHDSVNPKYIRKWEFEGKVQIYSDEFRGHSLFVSTENPKFEASLKAASAIGRRMAALSLKPTLHHAEPIKGENRELLSEELGIYNVPFAVLRHAVSPSVLFEVGVLVHREEERLLNDPAYRAKIQKALLDALEDFHSGSDASPPQASQTENHPAPK